MNSDIQKADTFAVDLTLDDVSVDDHDTLILPGGTINPDKLRQDARAVSLVIRGGELFRPARDLRWRPTATVRGSSARDAHVRSRHARRVVAAGFPWFGQAG
jgi:protease I